MVRGGGSRPDGVNDANSAVEARSCITPMGSKGSFVEMGSGRRAAAAIWHAGVQQSIFAWFAGLAGMCPPIVQPGMPAGAAKAPLAAAGLNASASAQIAARTSLITRTKYGDGINRVKPPPGLAPIPVRARPNDCAAAMRCHEPRIECSSRASSSSSSPRDLPARSRPPPCIARATFWAFAG